MPNAKPINPELILDHLKFARFDPAYAGKAFQMAEALSQDELKRFHGKSSHDSKEPGFYPAARLLQAYALTRIPRYEEAKAIVDEEIRRQRPRCDAQTDFFFANYIGLAAVIARQTDGPAKAVERLETLVDRVAAHMVKQRISSAKEDATDVIRGIINSELRVESASAAASMGFKDLLQILTDKSYYLLRPASSDAYEMPQYVPPSQTP